MLQGGCALILIVLMVLFVCFYKKDTLVVPNLPTTNRNYDANARANSLCNMLGQNSRLCKRLKSRQQRSPVYGGQGAPRGGGTVIPAGSNTSGWNTNPTPTPQNPSTPSWMGGRVLGPNLPQGGGGGYHTNTPTTSGWNANPTPTPQNPSTPSWMGGNTRGPNLPQSGGGGGYYTNIPTTSGWNANPTQQDSTVPSWLGDSF